MMLHLETNKKEKLIYVFFYYSKTSTKNCLNFTLNLAFQFLKLSVYYSWA